MGNRKRTIQKKLTLRKGDIVNAHLPGVQGKHICIILNDEPQNGHIQCIPVCNFTGSKVSSGEYAIDISKYQLPDNWFKNKKPQSWIRCNEKDCLYSTNFVKKDILGNIRDSFKELWDEVCNSTLNCPISDRLKYACDCNYQAIQSKIDSGLINEPDCGCAT